MKINRRDVIKGVGAVATVAALPVAQGPYEFNRIASVDSILTGTEVLRRQNNFSADVSKKLAKSFIKAFETERAKSIIYQMDNI